MPKTTGGDLMPVAYAAAKPGLHKATLWRQVKAGAVRSHGGKVPMSEVIADRAKNIDMTRSRRSEGKLDDIDAAIIDATDADATFDATSATLGATDGGDVVTVDGQALPYAEARALREGIVNLSERRRKMWRRSSLKSYTTTCSGKVLPNGGGLVAQCSIIGRREAMARKVEQVRPTKA